MYEIRFFHITLLPIQKNKLLRDMNFWTFIANISNYRKLSKLLVNLTIKKQKDNTGHFF